MLSAVTNNSHGFLTRTRDLICARYKLRSGSARQKFSAFRILGGNVLECSGERSKNEHPREFPCGLKVLNTLI